MGDMSPLSPPCKVASSLCSGMCPGVTCTQSVTLVPYKVEWLQNHINNLPLSKKEYYEGCLSKRQLVHGLDVVPKKPK